MKIVFAVRDRKNFVGGPAVDATRLLPELQRRGHQVHALCFWVGREKVHPNIDRLIAAGVPCTITKRQRYTEDGVQWILQQIKLLKPDIFIAALSTEGCFTAHWLRQAGIPVINGLYGDDPVNVGRTLYFSNCPPEWRVSGHFVFGETLRSKYASALKHKDFEIMTIAGMPNVPSDTASYHTSGLMSVVYAGRLTESAKRTGDMLKACVALGRRHHQFRFHLVGDAVGGERAIYEEFVKDSGAEDWITFHGILQGKAYYDELARHQVLMLLSDTEGLPGAVVDGMSVGLVPVCLRYVGVEDVIDHEVNGLIVEDREAGLEAALIRLSTDQEKWETLSRNAKEHIRTRVSPDVIMRKWEDFGLSMIASAGRRSPIEIPGRIRLPPVDDLLVEDRRKPRWWQRLLQKVSRFALLVLYACVVAVVKLRSGWSGLFVF